MANTGFIINTTVRQYFTSGPDSGSAVDTGSDVDLTVSPFSASLDNETFYNRAFAPLACPEGFETCLPPILTSLSTGSQRGRFTINYVTQSSDNSPNNITASVSNDINFSTSEVFSASLDSLIPVTTSFVSGTVYFKAFTSCSGPDQSPDSDPISFTYDLLPPPLPANTVQIIFKNNYSSAMEVKISSLRGNALYIINPKESLTYDYTTSPDQGAWTATGKSEPLNVTIKGGANSLLGNYIQRVTDGIEEETYTTSPTSGVFDNPLAERDVTSTFAADKGITFKITQLRLPRAGTTTTTTFTLLENKPEPTSVFGSIPFSGEGTACENVNVNYREKHYYKLDNILYDNLADAQSGTRTTFPYVSNYIITSRGRYILVSQNGRIIEEGECVYPTINLFTLFGAYPTQEEACKRTKVGGLASPSYLENDVNLADGRYPIYDASFAPNDVGVYRGGKNAIVSNRKIIAVETCGSDLIPVEYAGAFSDNVYPLETPELLSPNILQILCNYSAFQTYYFSPSTGATYQGFDSKNPRAYIQFGVGILSGKYWYKTSDGTWVIFEDGVITRTANPCNV